MPKLLTVARTKREHGANDAALGHGAVDFKVRDGVRFGFGRPHSQLLEVVFSGCTSTGTGTGTGTSSRASSRASSSASPERKRQRCSGWSSSSGPSAWRAKGEASCGAKVEAPSDGGGAACCGATRAEREGGRRSRCCCCRGVRFGLRHVGVGCFTAGALGEAVRVGDLPPSIYK